MAELSTEDRQRVWRGLMRWWSKLWEPVAVLSKSELLAAVNATDTWINDNQAAYKQSLSQTARDNLTAAQMTLLFCGVALARVSIDFLRQIFGEVD